MKISLVQTGLTAFRSVAIPLLRGGYKSKIAAAEIIEQISTTRLEYEQTAVLIMRNAEKGFRAGELTYVQYQQSLQQH